MMKNFNFNNNIVYKEGIKLLSLPSTIEKILVLEDSIVILVEYTPSVGNQNIFCFNFLKQLKWQIPKPIEFHSDNFYTGIYFRNSELYAYNVNGVEYHLEKETGVILKTELIK